MTIAQRGVRDVINDREEDRRCGEREGVRIAPSIKKDDSGNRAHENDGVHHEDETVQPEIGVHEIRDDVLRAHPGGDDAGQLQLNDQLRMGAHEQGGFAPFVFHEGDFAELRESGGPRRICLMRDMAVPVWGSKMLLLPVHSSKAKFERTGMNL